MGLLSKLFSLAFVVFVIIGGIYFFTGENILTGNAVKEAKDAVVDTAQDVNEIATEKGVKDKARSRLDELFYDQNDLIEDLFSLRESALENDVRELSKLVLKIDDKLSKFDDEELTETWDELLTCVYVPCEDAMFLNMIDVANQQ